MREVSAGAKFVPVLSLMGFGALGNFSSPFKLESFVSSMAGNGPTGLK